MALGSNYQNQQNNQSLNTPNYYSRMRIKNPKENMVLSFTFWNGTLKLTLNEYSNDGKTNELAYIYLSPTKARIFGEGIKKVMADEESSDIYGVDTGSGEVRGLIAIGRDKGNPFLFIGKVNGDGSYETSARFNFNVDYNYLLKVHDLSNLKYQKDYMNNVELNQILDLMNDFARYSSGAAGAAMYDIGRYESAKVMNLMKRIADSVGANTGGGNDNRNSGGGKRNNSFFNGADSEYSNPSSNNSNKSKSRYQNIDDLENELG